MGWTGIHATYYNGDKIDRKAQLDSLWNEGNHKVVKSTMKGAVYYAAIETPDGITGVVTITRVNMKNYFNFVYKVIIETMGPAESKCPKSILNLLSPTDSQFANEWRKRCRENIDADRNPKALKNLPIGSVIKFMVGGKTYEAIKHPPAYQFKRPFWMRIGEDEYVKTKWIPSTYTVVTIGENSEA